jgi:curved DNA-binding protein CbpA
MSAPKKVIRCHYEVLDIERTATSDEIRSSYKQLARKWHPDKNLDDPALAAERFKEVQQAYEVLSDPNERSWYVHKAPIKLYLFSIRSERNWSYKELKNCQNYQNINALKCIKIGSVI